MYKNSRDLEKVQGGNKDLREEGSVYPPSIDKGVQFSIDWLTVTVWCGISQALKLYQEYFRGVLGELNGKDRGGSGYESRFEGLGGITIYYTIGLERVTFRFPGKACQAIKPELYIEFCSVLDLKGIRFNFTRIDLAFDSVPFKPGDIRKAILDGQVRSLTQRKNIKWVISELKTRDDGSGVGCSTCYFGSRTSNRYLRVYDRRGPTRLELETKEERADMIARNLFTSKPEDWFRLAIGHIRDFIDVYEEYWKEFVGEIRRAYAKIVNLREISVMGIVRWLSDQVIPSLSVIEDCYPGLVKAMMKAGRNRQNSTQRNLVLEFQRSL